MLNVEKLSALFIEVYKRENAGLYFAIDVDRAELISMHIHKWMVDKWVGTGGFDEMRDRILVGRVPYPD